MIPLPLPRRCLAEFIGTFAIVFAGTGAIVVDRASHGAIGHAGIALTFGLVVLAMIHTFGDVSGAHLNPAVTLAFAAARRFPGRESPFYLGAQFAGALAASALLRAFYPADPDLGSTMPAIGAWQSLALEFVLTGLLMLVILGVSTGSREKGITAGIAIGSLIALEAMFAGPACGASMNPARSLAPAWVSGHPGNLWIYLAGPFAGALAALPVHRCIRGPGSVSP
jgi:aquaporin Z